jgi:hypothetical protein
MTASGFKDSSIWSFKSRGLEVESIVHYGFACGFMDRGPKVLLDVWKASLNLFSGSFGYKGKTELVQISIRISAVGDKTDALPSAPGGSTF